MDAIEQREPEIRELDNLQNSFLFKIPAFYSDEGNTSKNIRLLSLFSPILDQNYFKTNLEWFVVWERQIDKEFPELYFLVGENADSQSVVKLFISAQWRDQFSQYVMIPSNFCRQYQKQDISFVFSADEFDFADKGINNYILVINLKDLISKIPIGTLKNKQIENVSSIISQLKSYYDELTKCTIEINKIVEKIQTVFKKEIDHDSVIKLINCYFWLKLAFPADWRMIVYFPGIIAKEVASIPFGVNIGFKNIPSEDIIFFLKKITLLFFTRESVDFFEDKAEKEINERLKQEREIAHLLYEFPHIVGNYISLDIEKAIEFQDYDTPKKWAKFMKRMGTYMSSTLTSKDISQTLIQYNFKETIFNFYNMPLRLTVDKAKALNSRNDYMVEVDNWKKMFDIKSVNNINDSLNINLPEGVLEIIFSNLLSNTKKANKDYNACKVIITVDKEKERDKYIITYKENNGKGFDGSAIKKLSRWIREGPSEDEKTTGFGYRSMYKATVEISKGQMEIIVEYNGKEINVLDNHNSISIPDKKIFHPTHKFIFTSHEIKKLRRVKKSG